MRIAKICYFRYIAARIIFEDQYVLWLNVSMQDAYNDLVTVHRIRRGSNRSPCEFIAMSAAATSAQSFNLSSKHNLFPISEIRNWCISPHSVFSKTKTGETLSPSTKSQHTPSSVIIFLWFRISGWHSILISEISSRYRDSLGWNE